MYSKVEKLLYTYISGGRCAIFVFYVPYKVTVEAIIDVLNVYLVNYCISDTPNETIWRLKKNIITTVEDLNVQRAYKRIFNSNMQYVYIYDADRPHSNGILKIANV